MSKRLSGFVELAQKFRGLGKTSQSLRTPSSKNPEKLVNAWGTHIALTRGDCETLHVQSQKEGEYDVPIHHNRNSLRVAVRLAATLILSHRLSDE